MRALALSAHMTASAPSHVASPAGMKTSHSPSEMALPRTATLDATPAYTLLGDSDMSGGGGG